MGGLRQSCQEDWNQIRLVNPLSRWSGEEDLTSCLSLETDIRKQKEQSKSRTHILIVTSGDRARRCVGESGGKAKNGIQ